MKKILFLTFLIGGLFARDITLAEAEQLALKNNLQIKMSEASLKKSKASSRESVANFFPTVSSYYRLTDNLELSVMVMDPDGDGPLPPQEMEMGKQFNSNLGLDLSYPIFTGGAIINGQLAASSMVNLSELSLQDQVNTVIHTIRSLYYQAQMLESMIDATEKGLRSAKENYELAEKQLAAGKATRLDLLQAKVRYESYKPQLISLKNQRVSARTNLKTYINDPEIDTLNVVGKLEKIENPYSGLEIDDLLHISRNERLDLLMAEEQKKLAKYQRNIAWSNIMPKVQIGSGMQWQANTYDLNDLNHHRSSNISLSVSMPLFSGGKNAAGIQKAVIGVREANYRYEQTENHIYAEVDAAYRKVKETLSNTHANQEVILQAEEALRLSKLMYETGAATQLDLLNAESSYISARSGYIQSVFEYNLAVETLKKSLNNLSRYDGEIE
ncbi:MAG: TolC family protein [Candidatus Marinimicrobia bacterium]|nr:TolC family protein [Candidatus Neomarinimicrobiota bacterium]